MAKQKQEKSLEDLIKEANQRLKAAKTGLSIRANRNRLGFRGTLPPKPDSDRTCWYQQDLTPINRIPANSVGVREAEIAAHEIGKELARGIFDWKKYVKSRGASTVTVKQIIPKFKEEFFKSYDQHTFKKGLTTWNCGYFCYLKQLPQDAVVTRDLLVKFIKKYQSHPASQDKARLCMVRLGAFIGIEIDAKELNLSKYSRKNIKERVIPSDREIEEAYRKIPDRHWQIVFGLIAAYGLRPSEIWEIDIDRLKSGDRCLFIKDSKTGESREIYPFRPEWFDDWNLSEGCIPETQCKASYLKSTTINVCMRRADKESIPTGYSLRHAWAIRCIHYGVPDSVAARMMGHSLQEHNRTYQRWMNSRDIKQAVDTAIGNYNPFQR